MRIALASCSKIHRQRTQPAWKRIEREGPDLLLLLGDNVYGGSLSLSWQKFHKRIEHRYQLQFAQKHFKRLLARVPMHAIWDDHDFGKGDNARGALIKTVHKERSRELFHRYMNSSNNMPEVYHAFDQGDARIIMLDVRYYRDAPSPTASILGQQQEAWLERELEHDRKYTVICSGTCLTRGGERWSNYRDYYERFCDLARQKGRVVFLSGNIHKNRFVQHDGFFEVISSGVGRGKRDNYGIVDLRDKVVTVKLRGNRKSDNDDVVIDVDAWRVIAH